MNFLKAHYEKIILSVVLLGLAAAAALMPMKVSSERQKEEERKETYIRGKVERIKETDLTTNKVTLERLNNYHRLQFSGDHNIFNSVRWQRLPDGNLIKGTEAGLNALKITAINPLMLRVQFEGTTGEPGNIKYIIAVTKETERSAAQKRTAGKGQKNPLFALQDFEGPEDAPTSLSLLMAGDREPITISPGKAYERVIGYSAELFYEPENLKRTVKVKDDLSFGGETYNIVAITRNEVVVSAKSNKKQTTIEFKK